MDAVRVCDGKRGTGHLKRFFLFLLVDAQGSCKLQQDARRAAKTWNPEPSYTVVASFWSPIRPCELPRGVALLAREFQLHQSARKSRDAVPTQDIPIAAAVLVVRDYYKGPVVLMTSDSKLKKWSLAIGVPVVWNQLPFQFLPVSPECG